MKIMDKFSSLKYEWRKRREEKNLEKFNHRQEELDAKYKTEKQKSDFKTLLSRLKFETYTKRLVGFIIFACLIDLQLSYILAFLGKDQIAESLSIQICVTILGTALVYMIRAYFDTKAEKRDEMIKEGYIEDTKKSSIVPNDVIRNKIQETVGNSGLSEHINTEDIMPHLETENPDDQNYGN